MIGQRHRNGISRRLWDARFSKRRSTECRHAPSMNLLHRRPWAILSAVVWSAALGCAGSSSAASARHDTSLGASQKTAVHVTCAPAPIRKSNAPSWAEGVPPGLPYAVAKGAKIAGFFFTHPLRAGHPTNPENKVLWVAAAGPVARTLKITARLAGTERPAVHFTFPAASGGGIAFPSLIDLPSAGCWHLVLNWHARAADINIQVRHS
jgi:hypothetical protein